MLFPESLKSHQKKYLALGITIWVLLTATGFGLLASYSNTSGDLGDPPLLESVKLPVAIPLGKYTMVMAIHPKCPCTHASIGELARLIRSTGDRMTCLLLIYQPPQQDEEWQQTDLVDSAKRLTETILISDSAGDLAKQFGMATSGSVVLYSPRGEPVFHGGITVSRSHHGDNLGSDSIISIIRGQQAAVDKTPVFGCPIHSELNTCSKGPEPSCECRRP